jgi:hypothetical protein
MLLIGFAAIGFVSWWRGPAIGMDEISTGDFHYGVPQ